MADPSSADASSAEPPVPPNPVDSEPPVPPNPVDAEIVEAPSPSLPTVPPVAIDPDYTEADVPTFTHVRDKIEQRIGRAIGSEELAHETPAGRSVQEQWDAREKAAKEKLDQIRKSLHKDSGSTE